MSPSGNLTLSDEDASELLFVLELSRSVCMNGSPSVCRTCAMADRVAGQLRRLGVELPTVSS